MGDEDCVKCLDDVKITQQEIKELNMSKEVIQVQQQPQEKKDEKKDKAKELLQLLEEL